MRSKSSINSRTQTSSPVSSQFAADRLLQGFPHFDAASRDGPLAKEGLGTSTNEHGPALVDDHASHADHWAVRVFAGKGHSGEPQVRSAGKKLEFPCLGI